MAVMAAVLAPSLLGYVERSRAQKDDSAMGELTNSIKLALADQDVFDEVLAYTKKNTKSCYGDKDQTYSLPTPVAAPYIVTKEAIAGGASDQTTSWMLDDSERKLDETKYGFQGNMRGVTITFASADSNTNKATYDLSEGIVNGVAAHGSDCAQATAGTNLIFGSMTSAGGVGTAKAGKLYNRVRATVGDKIELSSQTYRNSEYTVFIRMGSTGGNQATAQDAIAVYGQWNGTNLAD